MSTCTDCLSEGCRWFDDGTFGPWTDRCAEDCPNNVEYCLAPKDNPQDQSLLEYCLRSSPRLSHQECNESRNYFEKTITKPCSHCLHEGCAWDEIECRENCTNATGECVTYEDFDATRPYSLEQNIVEFCQQGDAGNTPCSRKLDQSSSAARETLQNSLAVLLVLGFL